jgi:hypothetical protein
MNYISGVPYKSVAGALILAIVFGPIGLYYSSLIGGVVMTLFGLVAAGMVVNQKTPLPMCTVWLISIVWAMTSIRWYNKQLWQTVQKMMGHDVPSSKLFGRKGSATPNE